MKTVISERLAEALKNPLYKGSHQEPSKKMCVMEAVSYVAGEEFSDSPACASQVIASFMRAWNDTLSDEGREKLKPYIEKLVGSAGNKKQEQRRGLMAASWYLTVFTPTWLELAGLHEHAEALKTATIASWGDVKKIKPDLSAAESAAESAARSAARSAAESAAEKALAPTTERLQKSAFDLLDAMLAVQDGV